MPRNVSAIARMTVRSRIWFALVAFTGSGSAWAQTEPSPGSEPSPAPEASPAPEQSAAPGPEPAPEQSTAPEASPDPEPSAVTQPSAPSAVSAKPAPIEAAAPPTIDSDDLKAVVVTAQRREESVQSVPTPVSVLDGDDMIDSGIGRSAKEVLDYVPNASAVTQGHGRPRWWIRGVGTGQQQMDFSNPIGFYIDDVFIGNATATGFPLFDLDRVEILRGPQGTLWGKNTTGGAINALSRRPEFTYDGYLKFDYGRFRSKVYEGALGGPIWEDKLAARGSFHYEDSAGRFQNLTTGRREGQLKDGALRLQLLGKLSPRIEAIANVHARQYSTNGNTATVTGTGPGGEYLAGYVPSTNPRHVATNAPNGTEISQMGALLNVQADLGEGYALTSIAGWESFKNRTLGDGDNTPLEISRSWGKASSYQFSEELRLSSPREDRVNWIAGLYGLTEKIDSESASARLPGVEVPIQGPSSYSYTQFEHETWTVAAFASATANVTRAFSVTAGLRWTYEKRTLDFDRFQSNGAQFSNIVQWWEPSSVSTPFDGGFAVEREKDWNNWTWDVTPKYELTKSVSAYFRYAHGVKSGGFNTAATTEAALITVAPESLDNFELGLKTAFFGNRLILNASAFHYIYRDIQINVVGPLPPTNTQVSYLQNAERGRVYGAELELDAHPIENFQVAGSVGLLDAKFTDFVVRDGPDYSGNSFVRSPHLTTLLRASWDIPLPVGAQPIVQLSGDWRFQSRQFHYTTGQDNPLLQTEPFSIVNLRVTLKSNDEKVSLTGYVNNALDVQYVSHSGQGATNATGATTTWGEPLTFGGWLTTRWF